MQFRKPVPEILPALFDLKDVKATRDFWQIENFAARVGCPGPCFAPVNAEEFILSQRHKWIFFDVRLLGNYQITKYSLITI